MKLYDGNKMVDIQMNNWTGNDFTPDWSNDFFDAGNLPYDEELDAYMVEDVDYCIEQAMDWKNADGDFYEPDADTSDRHVGVTFLALYRIRRDVDISMLGDHATLDMRFTEEMIKEDAHNFGMTTEEYMDTFFEPTSVLVTD